MKTVIVKGTGPHCNVEVRVVSLASDHVRCKSCGTDVEQKSKVK